MFDQIYRRLCQVAVNHTVVQQAGRDSIFRNLCERLQIDYQQLKESVGQSLPDQHRQRLEGMHSYLTPLKSHRTCLCCLLQAPEKVLSCGHAICDVCVRTFGSTNPEAHNTFAFSHCLLCGQSNQKSEIALVPATAGVRLLSIDGGGIRGVVPLVFLQHLQDSFNELQVPLRDLFDFVSGTSAGKIRSLPMYIRY